MFGSILEVYPKDWSGWDNVEFANIESILPYIYIYKHNYVVWTPHPLPPVIVVSWMECSVHYKLTSVVSITLYEAVHSQMFRKPYNTNLLEKNTLQEGGIISLSATLDQDHQCGVCLVRLLLAKFVSKYCYCLQNLFQMWMYTCQKCCYLCVRVCLHVFFFFSFD